MLELNEIHNPFPGIRPFEMDETNLFFGRDGQSDELLKRMQHTRLLAVVGTSGSGKSSLIRAGLLPALFGGLMGDAGSSWRIAIHRPGGDPVGNLAAALADRNVFGLESDSEIQTTLIETTLRRSSIGLIDVARQARMAEHENLLVVVDQFEELFRFKQAQSGDDATVFVKLLLEASAQQEIPIYIIITMRSDFLGDCSQFTGLPEAINNGQYLIPRMSRDERQSAIVGPIAVGQGQITAPLVSRLLNDVGDNPDQLPILQHALMRTWNYWSAHRLNGNPIGLDDYLAIGTMAEALSRHADEAFNELPDERSRLIAEKLFKRLTEKGTDNREIRRPTRLDELCAVCEATQDEVSAIIDVFRCDGRSFLMPPAGARLTGETVIDISHESLIRNWARLQQWVDEEAQSSRTYRRLAEAAVLHREGSEGLLQDPGLQIALDWLAKSKPNEAWARRYHSEFDEATKYLTESRLAREAAQHEREQQRNAELERERREREQAEIYAAGQAKAARRLRWLAAGMGLMFLMSVATAAYAIKSRSTAVRARDAEVTARNETQKSLDALQQAQDKLNTQQVVLQNSVRETEKANEALQTARARAEAEANRARLAAAQAVAARADALQKARIARDEQANAEFAQKRAEQLADKNEKAKVANDYFREAALNVQRGKYENAKEDFSSAIKGYKNPIVGNDEGEADATVEIGSLALAVGKQTFAQVRDFRMNNVMGDLDTAIQKYDEAANIYAGSKLNAIDKAAATNFSLAMNLLPLANGTLAKSKAPRAGEEFAGWTGAEGEVPLLQMGVKLDGGPASFNRLDYDPVTRLKDETVKHLNLALTQYRRVYESRQNVPENERWNIEASRVGMQKAAYQLGEFFLKQSFEESTNLAYKTDTERQKAVEDQQRQAAHHFEILLSTYQMNDDREIGRLLIWLGGLYQSLGKTDQNASSIAEGYFRRVGVEMDKLGSTDAGTLSLIGEELEEHGQRAEALDFYQRAGQLFKNANNKLAAAASYYDRGRIYEAQSNFNQASDCYETALSLYQSNLEPDDSSRIARDLVAIGSFLKQVGKQDRALEAFDMAIKSGGRLPKPWLMTSIARAYAEKGGIFSQQRKARDAINAYRLAIPLYDNVAASDQSSGEQKDEATAELRRIRLIVSALENALTTPP